MYGDLGYKLTQHASRTLHLPHLPPYATELIRAILLEIRSLDADVSAILAPFDGQLNPSHEPVEATKALVCHLGMRRNKRCLLAYARVRAQRLEEVCWKGEDGGGFEGQGEGLEGGGGRERERDVLSPEEEEYMRRFGDLLGGYKGQWTDVDLTGSLEPPRDLFIDVRCLRDAGEIQTEYGAINLTKNSQFYVRQGDVERLIAQGYLQKLG